MKRPIPIADAAIAQPTDAASDLRELRPALVLEAAGDLRCVRRLVTRDQFGKRGAGK
jgi:hypothetical protein